MPANIKAKFVDGVQQRFGRLRKLEHSQSLYEVGDGVARIYVRYSRVHGKYKTFYGLRQDDLRQLEGHNSVICFLWDGQQEPLVVPFSDYEEILLSTAPAGDG